MKKGTRLYINITNACNTDCPFCCMYSGTNNNGYMSFDTFKSIVDSCQGDFELQLEGGEPLLHKDIFLFIEYAISTNRCRKVIILTNGLELQKFVERFRQISVWNGTPFEFKISVNYWLLEKNPNHIKDINYLVFATKYIPGFDIRLNVRKRKEKDAYIEELIEQYNLEDISSVYYFQSYGKLKDSKEYDKPVIVPNIEDWKIYASDGTCFSQDLEARSEYEHNKI